jgi:hypothetical protein
MKKENCSGYLISAVSETAAATSSISATVSAASAAVTAATAVASASSAVSASAASEWSSFLFVCFTGHVVLRVDLCGEWFCGHVEFAVFAYVEAYVAFEQGYVAVFNADCVAFVDFVDVVIPEREVNYACLVADEGVADFVG